MGTAKFLSSATLLPFKDPIEKIIAEKLLHSIIYLDVLMIDPSSREENNASSVMSLLKYLSNILNRLVTSNFRF